MPVLVNIQNDVALIRMDDGKANAINLEKIAALNAALDKAEARYKAIVLAGRDARFSGGFDLKAFASLGADGVYKLLDAGAELLLRPYGGQLPVVAACTGGRLLPPCVRHKGWCNWRLQDRCERGGNGHELANFRYGIVA